MPDEIAGSEMERQPSAWAWLRHERTAICGMGVRDIITSSIIIDISSRNHVRTYLEEGGLASVSASPGRADGVQEVLGRQAAGGGARGLALQQPPVRRHIRVLLAETLASIRCV